MLSIFVFCSQTVLMEDSGFKIIETNYFSMVALRVIIRISFEGKRKWMTILSFRQRQTLFSKWYFLEISHLRKGFRFNDLSPGNNIPINNEIIWCLIYNLNLLLFLNLIMIAIEMSICHVQIFYLLISWMSLLVEGQGMYVWGLAYSWHCYRNA